MDVTQYIKAKSDQLNADDLMGGPVTVKIMGVKEGSKEQPVIIEIDGGHQPFKPSKTDRRVLVAAWGAEADKWIGRSMMLFRDPTVVYAGVQVGGIRVTHLSDIEGDMKLMLSETRGKKKERLIKKLMVNTPVATTKTTEKKAPTAMSDEEFLKRLTVAKASIDAGKATAEQVIAKIEAAVLLTEAQREELETLKPAAPGTTEASPEANQEANPDDMFDN